MEVYGSRDPPEPGGNPLEMQLYERYAAFYDRIDEELVFRPPGLDYDIICQVQEDGNVKFLRDVPKSRKRPRDETDSDSE